MKKKQNLYIGLIRMKILLLEDEMMLNNAIAEYLTNIGHIVKSFTDGQEVTDDVDDSYDLLILDINVPNKDGFEILQELKALECDLAQGYFIAKPMSFSDLSEWISLKQ